MRVRPLLLCVSALALLVTTALPSQSQAQAKLEFQSRVDAFNLFNTGFDDDGILLNFFGVVPIVSTGVRLVDDKLYVGLGFGYVSVSSTNCETPGGDDADCEIETTSSSSSWSLSPTVSFDVLTAKPMALAIVGWFNFGTIDSSKTETTQGGNTVTLESDGDFWWGFNLGVGIRGYVTEGVAVGTEWGWSFANRSDGNNEGDGTTFHGIWGTINIVAAIPL